MELKNETEEWMQKYLQKASHIKLRPSGLNSAFEVLVDEKNLEDEILMRNQAVFDDQDMEKPDSCINLTP